MVEWEDSGALEEVRADLFVRLNARRLEIEEAILTRISSVSSAAGAEDGEYADGLQSAVSAGVTDALAGVEPGSDQRGPVPGPLLAQARQAARNGVTLDVVLRRYIAGYTLFNDFVMRAAEDTLPLPVPAFRPVMHAQAARFERLVAAAVGEYTRERGHRHGSPERRRVKCVKELLAGESVGRGELTYEFDEWHVGVIARGNGAASVLRRIAEAVDRRLLLVRPEKETVWAWFGGRRRIVMAEVARHLSPDECGDALVALGEPARGIDGWRLTHQQASAALRIARPGSQGIVFYADVALLASISQDRVLASSLQQLYLSPLAEGREDGGAGLRETLRAYFSAGRNVTSAASALGVSRQTVGSRMRTIEERLGRTLESCAADIEVALRLEAVTGLVELGPAPRR